MTSDPAEHWGASVANSAWQTAPVAEGVCSTIKTKLQGVMSERALRPAEFKELAADLIDVAMKPPDTGEQDQ